MAEGTTEPTLPTTEATPATPAPVWPAPKRPAGASIIPAQLARLAWLCMAASGLILAAVLAGNGLLLLAGIAPTLWLIALVDIGPLIALFLGNVATILGYYGTWRILRQLDEYSVRDDAQNQLMQAPGMLQNLPQTLRRRFGCVHLVTLGTLAVSLVVTGLTLAPPPWRALGVSVVVVAPTPTAVASATILPTATTTPTISLQANPTSAQQQCASDGTLPPLNVTLDNTASAAAVTWSAAISDTVPNTNLAWATANPSSGSVDAGAIAIFALTPTGRLCYASKQPTIYHATITLDNGAVAPITISDTITPPQPPATFAVAQNQDMRQTCVAGAVPSVPPYNITLSNSLTTSVNWSIGQFDLNVNGSPWASASPSSGLAEPGTTSTVTITPSTIACQIAATTTWHAQITASTGATITITDTVTP